MTAWPLLVRAAMVGVQRNALPGGAVDPPLDRLVEQLSDRPPEAAALAVAAVLSQHDAVGRVPAPPAAAPHRFLADNRPLCPPDGAVLLAMMLDGAYTPQLPDLLHLLAQSGCRLPAALIPQLLERGVSIPSVRQAVIELVGERGRRLAAEHPDWGYATAALESWGGLRQLWDKTDAAHRRHLFMQIRQRDPQMARDLLQAIWKQESPTVRSQLVTTLQSGLSMEDEPFLEAALDDRTETVRRTASELLARLPESRLRRRMVQAMEGLLHWTPEAETQITVQPPSDIAASTQRDGVTVRQMNDIARLRSAQLTAMVSAVSLSHWEQSWQAEPAAIVRAAQSSRWPRTLMTGWAVAAEYQGDARWGEALLVEGGFELAIRRCVAILTPPQFDDLLARHAGWSTPLHKDDRLVVLVRRWPHGWSDYLAGRWVDAMTATLAAPGAANPDSIVKTALKQFAQSAPPTWVDAAVEQWLPQVDFDSPWYMSVMEAIGILRIRRRMDVLRPAVG